MNFAARCLKATARASSRAHRHNLGFNDPAIEEAVVDAGAVRFRPMLLTALAVVVGASVILADPIFQGLAIALMAGEIASLLISRMAVPVLYFMIHRRREATQSSTKLTRPEKLVGI